MNTQTDQSASRRNLGTRYKTEMFGGFEMRVAGRIKENILSALMVAALLFLIGTPAHAAGVTLFTTQAPKDLAQSDGANVTYELGTVFQSNVAGQITAIRFWKDAKETGTHTGHVWSGGGKLLATVTFVNETASGWQQQALSTPLSIAASTKYVVTVNTGGTYYVSTTYGLASKITNGNLSTVVGNNGLYGYPGKFPTHSWNASNYFRDIVFVPSAISSSAAIAPAITTQPSSKSITAGQTATFTMAATGTSPMTYQWSKNGAAISGATSSTYTTPAETTSDNNAKFTVAVSNSAGSVISNAAILTVNAVAVAPAITSQPASQSVMAGQSATFNVAATGTSPMTFQWRKNGTAISGAIASTYTTPAETTTDNKAQFTVAVGNTMGTATSNTAVLTVNSVITAPTITTQPANQTVVAGQTATFTVSTTGTSPMTYQWSKNGSAISGATLATYTTPAETISDNNAKFAVAVSNSAGNATSNAATLTVKAATLALNASTSSVSFGSVTVSSTSSKNVTLTNAGNSTITVSGVTVSGAGFNASGVSTGLILNPGQTATLTATFSPSTAVSVTGSIAVASNASNSPDTIALSGTGVAVVNHSATLSWTPSTSAVTGYNTYSTTTSGGPYKKLNSTPDAVTSYTDSTVQAGQTYYYVVTDVDSSGTESIYSNEVSATIP